MTMTGQSRPWRAAATGSSARRPCGSLGRWGLAAGGAEAEAAEDEQRLLAERAPRRQHSELDGGVVEVEEAANAEQVVALELAVEDAVDDDEPVGRRQAFELRAVRPEQLARRRDVMP